MSQEPTLPLVSIIIPNLNSPLIAKTLTAIHQQTFDLRQVEVIVVGMDQPKLVQPNALVQLIMTEKPLSAAANRNRGIAAARGQFLCFTDADCVPSTEWLQRLMSHFQTPTVHVVGGGIVFDKSNYWAVCDHLSWFDRNLASSSVGERNHLPTLNLAIRRQVVEVAGGMDESFPVAAGEDTEWTERMRKHGYRLRFDPLAIVTHAAQRHSFHQLWSHAFRYGHFSPKIRTQPKNNNGIDQLYSLIPQSWWLLMLLAPLLATFATFRIVVAQSDRQTLFAMPGIWLSKLAWCMGATTSLWSLRER